MQGATHFIEQWKVDEGVYGRSPIIRIEHLKEILDITIEHGFKTIAVWKIKLKEKTKTDQP